jgi:hypothetical protein
MPPTRLWLSFAAGFLAMPSGLAPAQAVSVHLEIRAFDGSHEVTGETLVKVFAAGTREQPLKGTTVTGRGVVLEVPVGLYDAQAIRQREGQVLSIRWAERLLAQRYPDEDGRHLEIINFQRGFGAIQLRVPSGVTTTGLEVAAFAPGARVQPVAQAVSGADYVLLVLPAGRYDLRVSRGGEPLWMTDVDIPADRTRMKAIPVN